MAKAVFCIATSEEQAETIVNQLKEGASSYNDLSVHADDQQTTCRARDILEQAGAEDIASAGEVGLRKETPEPEPESAN